jgi:hypothetical protein
LMVQGFALKAILRAFCSGYFGDMFFVFF